MASKSNSRADDGPDTPPRKKQKRYQTFRKEYTEKYSFIREGKGESWAHCAICSVDFSIRSGGGNDIERHIKTDKHNCNERIQKQKAAAPKITGFLVTNKGEAAMTSKEEAVLRAEAMAVDLVLELNLPMSSLDTLSKAFKVMFKDSEIAQKFACGRSKGTAVAKEIAAQTTLTLGERMKCNTFSISTDGSNDNGSQKLFPLVVRSIDLTSEEVRSDVLSVPCCEGSATGEKIFKLIETELQIHDIPWENCIAFGCDNANVMVGEKGGVYGHLLKQHPKMYLSGCVCHLIHIAAEKGAASLPVDVGRLLVDVFYYLDKSSKRQAAFKDAQLLLDLQQSKILKHVATRWLSIGKCLQRLLHNWDALYYFFKEQEKNAKGSAEKEKTSKLKQNFGSLANKVYCMFLLDAITEFDSINTELQSDEPKLHIMKSRLEAFFTSLLRRFVKPSAMLYKHVLDVEFQLPYNVRENNDLIIGDAAMQLVGKLKEEIKAAFYKHVKEFFKTSCSYIKEKLPFKNDLLKHAQVVDPLKQTDVKFESVKYFLDRFPKMLADGASVTDVQKEFACYQTTDIRKCLEATDRVDATWVEIGKLKEEGQPVFKLLVKVMLSVLTIPHSSAHCERLFSMVRKNKTDFRSRMGQETLEAIVVAKARPGMSVDRQYTSKQLQQIKSAYYKSLLKQ